MSQFNPLISSLPLKKQTKNRLEESGIINISDIFEKSGMSEPEYSAVTTEEFVDILIVSAPLRRFGSVAKKDFVTVLNILKQETLSKVFTDLMTQHDIASPPSDDDLDAVFMCALENEEDEGDEDDEYEDSEDDEISNAVLLLDVLPVKGLDFIPLEDMIEGLADDVSEDVEDFDLDGDPLLLREVHQRMLATHIRELGWPSVLPIYVSESASKMYAVVVSALFYRASIVLRG